MNIQETIAWIFFNDFLALWEELAQLFSLRTIMLQQSSGGACH